MAPTAHFSRRIVGTSKGTVALMRAKPEDVALGEHVALPELIVFQRYNRDAPDTVRIEAADRIRCFTGLVDQAVNYNALRRKGFDTVSRLAEHCRAFELEFSDIDAAIAALTQACEASRKAGCAA